MSIAERHRPTDQATAAEGRAARGISCADGNEAECGRTSAGTFRASGFHPIGEAIFFQAESCYHWLMEKPLVFISCGQYTDDEKRLGLAIASLINTESEYEAYFAENQNTLEGLSSNILAALARSAAFVGVMHDRGTIDTPDGRVLRRGSVWVEQEVAIAAFIQNVLARPIEVALYIQKGISLEGIRQQLRLKPFEFENPDEVIDDLRSRLKGWRLDVGKPDVGLQFASPETRRAIGQRLGVSVELWRLPDDLPDRSSNMLGIGLLDGPPGIRDIAEFNADRAARASLGFVLNNDGDRPLINARAEIDIAKTDDYRFADDSEVASEPSSRFGTSVSFNPDIVVEELGDRWQIEMTFGNVPPKGTRYLDFLHVYPRRSVVIQMEAVVYAESLSLPTTVPLEVDLTVSSRTISNGDVLNLIEDYD